MFKDLGYILFVIIGGSLLVLGLLAYQPKIVNDCSPISEMNGVCSNL